MPTAFRFFARWPLAALHALGAVLGWIAFLASPTYRRRFLANASLAGYPFSRVRGAVAHAGRMAAELPRLWLHPGAPAFRMEGEAYVEQAWAAGRGIVFLTPHIGCFELSVQIAAQRWAPEHGPFTVLYRPARQAWLAELMRTARDRPGIRAVPTALSGVRQMIKALRRGEAVGLLPDQVPPEGLGLWSPFFGQPAYTMTLAARLVQQTGAAVILARCERLPRGRGYVLHFEPLAEPLSSSLETAVLQINQSMERTIRHSPDQYLWGYGRYKHPRAEASTPAAPGADA
ncbi:lysophospholipid acyltransferase family protein [Paracidovorax avenae]|uniref:lysophospholipid acyltransferase family protein n=1 Tax=Paracidovorax avenae TaxID=80867 RepID=UPI000D167B1D|nr:lysophospholipid acyltransferase family protein [Paracidovorax avenae]AVS87504.1 lipid A biosynthesis acyltransferase [Paracidovorax avenae]AVS98128.1 lipid A biosynthesis acyltransferase [Paracidovorax avenae]AVT01715.1 lipid A biosynthesis acyltransferase [Paracidovorax avenae]AVT05144.1 lipid A biosynthesis acyltransferase [Paracidovorax avenae]